jgi:hypothetical protein
VANDYFLISETTTSTSVCASVATEDDAVGDVVYIDEGMTHLALGIEEDEPLILQSYFRHHAKRFCADPVLGLLHLRDWLQLRGHKCSLIVNPGVILPIRLFSHLSLFFAIREYEASFNQDDSEYDE